MPPPGCRTEPYPIPNPQPPRGHKASDFVTRDSDREARVDIQADVRSLPNLLHPSHGTDRGSLRLFREEQAYLLIRHQLEAQGFQGPRRMPRKLPTLDRFPIPQLPDLRESSLQDSSRSESE